MPLRLQIWCWISQKCLFYSSLSIFLLWLLSPVGYLDHFTWHLGLPPRKTEKMSVLLRSVLRSPRAAFLPAVCGLEKMTRSDRFGWWGRSLHLFTGETACRSWDGKSHWRPSFQTIYYVTYSLIQVSSVVLHCLNNNTKPLCKALKKSYDGA